MLHLRDELAVRLDRIALHPPKRAMDIPEPFAKAYFGLMPIHKALRGNDFPTTTNYLKIAMCNIHDELTGRDNIFLNGTILGMRHTDIARRVDQIVAFAGVEELIDAPVKTYSSGNRMRLAFSVAAHLDRDIYLLDEVLAVGDEVFQVKCLARVRELAAEGRTVLIVNHSAEVIRGFCSRAVLLHRGRLLADGAPESVIARYHAVDK